MKYKELTNKTGAELQKLLKTNREKLRDLRFKVANKQLKDIRRVRAVRQEIAQILTILNQAKIAGEKPAVAAKVGQAEPDKQEIK